MKFIATCAPQKVDIIIHSWPVCKVFTQTPDKIWSNRTFMKCSDAATSNLQIFKSVRVRTRSRLWHVIKFIKGENAENERSWVMICYKNFRQKRWQGDCRYKKKPLQTNKLMCRNGGMYVCHTLLEIEVTFFAPRFYSWIREINFVWDLSILAKQGRKGHEISKWIFEVVALPKIQMKY